MAICMLFANAVYIWFRKMIRDIWIVTETKMFENSLEGKLKSSVDKKSTKINSEKSIHFRLLFTAWTLRVSRRDAEMQFLFFSWEPDLTTFNLLWQSAWFGQCKRFTLKIPAGDAVKQFVHLSLGVQKIPAWRACANQKKFAQLWQVIKSGWMNLSEAFHWFLELQILIQLLKKFGNILKNSIRK